MFNFNLFYMKLNLKSAAPKGLNHHPYTCCTVTSADFAQLTPLMYIDCIGRDEWNKVHSDGIVRVAPQVFPPYGRAFFKTAAFFVPEYQIFESADSFRENQSSHLGSAVVRPWFKPVRINQFFASYSDEEQGFAADAKLCDVIYTSDYNLSNLPSDDKFDFHMVIDNSGNSAFKFYKLTARGRYFYKILKSLGYAFVSFNNEETYAQNMASCLQYYDAVPFLSYLKVYVDYFLSGAQYNSSPLVKMLHSVKHNVLWAYGNNTYTPSSGELNAISMLFSVLVPHEQNMYTSAWNAPNSPTGVSPQDETLNRNSESLVGPYNSNLLRTNQYNNVAGIDNGFLTAFGFRVLKAFDRFITRNNLAGSKAVQRVYARLGIKSADFKSNYVHKLYEKSDKFQFFPVMSNSDTYKFEGGVESGQPLGAFAGYSASSLNIDFNYKCDDYGCIIVLGWVQVVPMLLHGVNPRVLRKEPFDFYTPEYDGTTVRPIPLCEVSQNKRVDRRVLSLRDTAVYGYTNLYDDYRNMRDIIAGDFVNGFTKDFLFCRDLSKLREDNVPLKPQSDVVQYYAQGENSDMSNPFIMQKSKGDRFWIYLDWDMDSNRLLLREADSFDLGGEGDLTIDKNGVMES